jgi:rhodanese-related sulfurtransferase
MSVVQISAKVLQKKLKNDDHLCLLDVREDNEFEFSHIKGSIHMPLNQVPQRIKELDSGSETIVICHHGIRSQQAAVFLDHSGFNQIYNLSGGIDAWSVECDSTVLRY